VLRISLFVLSFAVLTSCGVGANTSRSLSTAQALTQPAEWLEFEAPQVRKELLADVLKTSTTQVGSTGAVLFPVQRNGEFKAGPSLTAVDLLGNTDSGDIHIVEISGQFSDDRREAFQGLSEREIAEQVARSLLAEWNISSKEIIRVARTPASGWAVAFVENELRINPAFLYLAAQQ
jgi:hypothetical protein